MPKHNILLIANPNAGLGRAWRWASDLRPVADEFGGADWAGTVYPTHAAELARRAAEDGSQLVVAVGGDGTVYELIDGLMEAPPETRPRLEVVPMGSDNDFAHSAGMDERPAYALRQVLTGKPRRMDIGRLQTILLNHEAPCLQVVTDGERREAPMLLLTLCNGGREGGGFQISPPARIDDGVLQYTGVNRVSRLGMLRLLPEFMRGTHGRSQSVRMGEFHRLELQADRPLIIHADGEIFAGFGMDVRQLQAEIIPGAIELMS